MKQVTAKWVDGLQFVATGSDGHAIVLDGEGRGFSPSEILLAALAGCTGIDVIGILRKQRQKVSSLEIIVKGEQLPDPPWTYQKVEVEYVVKGEDIKESAVARAIELSETKYCSVGATISDKAKIVSSFRIEEARP
ncbi:MAG: OsmC family protein [Chloroflexi bacterium]|nr:OsmC family protein [Chloroflexota bacterium]